MNMRGLCRFLIAAGLLASGVCFAGDPVDDPMPGPVQGRVLRVIDGDTIRVRARIWLGQEVETNVRLRGVDAPETHGKCPEERELSRQATQLIERVLADAQTITLSDISYDKYGRRVVARIITTAGQDLSQLLLQNNLGHVYGGGHKAPWCSGRQDRVGKDENDADQ